MGTRSGQGCGGVLLAPVAGRFLLLASFPVVFVRAADIDIAILDGKIQNGRRSIKPLHYVVEAADNRYHIAEKSSLQSFIVEHGFIQGRPAAKFYWIQLIAVTAR